MAKCKRVKTFLTEIQGIDKEYEATIMAHSKPQEIKLAGYIARLNRNSIIGKMYIANTEGEKAMEQHWV